MSTLWWMARLSQTPHEAVKETRAAITWIAFNDFLDGTDNYAAPDNIVTTLAEIIDIGIKG